VNLVVSRHGRTMILRPGLIHRWRTAAQCRAVEGTPVASLVVADPRTVPGYPPAPRQDVVDLRHGQRIADPYRWLEDPDSEATRDWSRAQDELTRARLDELPGRRWLADRLGALLSAGSVGAPLWRAGRRFATRREPGQELAVLYVTEPDTEGGPGSPIERERVLLDPTAIDPTGSTTLDAWVPDLEGRRLAYQLSEGGDEHSVLHVLDITTGEPVQPPIDRCRYSSVAWLPGGAEFIYVRMVAEAEAPDGEQAFHRRVWRHRVGADPDTDELLDGPGLYIDHTYYGTQVSRDGRWLLVSGSIGTARRTSLWITELSDTDSTELSDTDSTELSDTNGTELSDTGGGELSDPGGSELSDPGGGTDSTPPLRPVLTQADDVRANAWVERDGRLYLHTTDGARRWRLMVTDPRRPDREHWRELVAEDPEAIVEGVRWLQPAGTADPADGVLVLARARHAVAELALHRAADGAPLGEVTLPGTGSLAGWSVADRDTPTRHGQLWICWTDPLTPPELHRFELASGRTELERPAPGRVEVPASHIEQREFRSADGTTVRMFVVSPADVPRSQPTGSPDDVPGSQPTGSPVDAPGSQPTGSPVDAPGSQPTGPRPALLTGYGGFGLIREPTYRSSALAWVAAGGVYALVSLRGGGEEGEDWHRAGMREHKQNVFDDLHAAAEALVAAGTTSYDRLAIQGGSNGGLLVGAALTQRPSAYRAVVCSAPLLDMVRYEEFSLGRTWNDEYGTADDPTELGWLLSYSPYHHVRAGTEYPAVLFTVFDSDTRVDPAHARKMCAALQYASSGDPAARPVLLRRETDVGHGARSVSRTLNLGVDQLAFLAAHTGLELP